MALGRSKPIQLHDVVYVTPRYLLNAVQRKYGRRIIVIGAEEGALARFWSTLETKGANFNNDERPVVDSKLAVDITAKEHCNIGDTDDVMEVETSQEEKTKQKTSYTLGFGKESGWEFGGGLKIGASFFNTASAFLGIEGKRNKSKWRSQEETIERERELAQTYGVKATEITVPPKTKVAVTITTYAVTYKLKVKVIISVPATSSIPFYYRRTGGLNCCGGGGRMRGEITAAELFQDQNEFQDLGYCIQFRKESELSYVGETVELYKEETKLPPRL